MKLLNLSILFVFLFWVWSGSAATTDSAVSSERSWNLGVSVGYGQRSNPLVGADPLTMVAVIDLSWYGKRWFFDNGDVGFTLEDNELFTLNSVLKMNGERLYFEHANSLLVSFVDETNSGTDAGETPTDGNGGSDGGDGFKNIEYDIPDRNIALEAGVEFLTDGDWGFFNVAAFSDVSDTHGGYQLDVGYGQSFLWRQWVFSGSLDLSWKSEQLNNYYYGVRKSESNNEFPEYHADAGVNVSARILARYYLTKHVSMAALLEAELLSDAVADSPFVDDDVVTTAYVGVKYNF